MLLILFSRSMRCCELSDDIAIWNSVVLVVLVQAPTLASSGFLLAGDEGKTESPAVQFKTSSFLSFN